MGDIFFNNFAMVLFTQSILVRVSLMEAIKKILSSEAKILNVTKACDMFDTMFDASLLSPKCFMNPFLCQVMHNKNVLFLENWLGEI